MRKLIRNIILITNVLFGLLLVTTYLSVYVSPLKSWIFAFIGMAYPFLLIINIIFVIFWAILKKWLFIFSTCCILLGWNFANKYVQFRFKRPTPTQTDNTVRLVTYNVRLFNFYNDPKNLTTWNKIAEYIHTQKPDIVCFQEFLTLSGKNPDLQSMKKLMEPLLYSHVNYTYRIPGKFNFGLASFSKFPIIRKESIDFENTLNGIIVSDLVIKNDTFRIFNCHLQSIRLRNDYRNLLDSLLFNYSDKQLDELKDVSLRMRQAFVLRAEQVDILVRHIKSSPYPVIVCGDFNDTPVSYTYHKLSRNLKDAFIQSGSGTGNTFRGNFPYVRIDYVLFSPEFDTHHYRTGKVDWSDHYPVITDFTIRNVADSTVVTKSTNNH